MTFRTVTADALDITAPNGSRRPLNRCAPVWVDVHP
jgi:hypothetical protein